ncbi:MAG: hypothetical protein N2C14_01110, partial [Planctomycetales bacterium]
TVSLVFRLSSVAMFFTCFTGPRELRAQSGVVMRLRHGKSWVVLVVMLAPSWAFAEDQKDEEHELARPERVFDTGLNLGWLSASLETGVAARSRGFHATVAARHFSQAFTPPLKFDPPQPRPAVVIRYQAAVMRTLTAHAADSDDPLLRASPDLARGGYHLARAHLLAQQGEFPAAMSKELNAAGMYLARVGQRSRRVELVRLGGQLVAAAKKAPRYPSSSRMREFTVVLTNVITLTRGGLHREAANQAKDDAEEAK